MHEDYGILFVCLSVITLALLPDTEYSHLVLTERQKRITNQINMSHTTRLWDGFFVKQTPHSICHDTFSETLLASL